MALFLRIFRLQIIKTLPHMKRFPGTILLLLITSLVYAQKEPLTPPDMPRSEENNQVYYMEVVEEGADAQELFKRANVWLRKFYKNPTGVVETADSVKGQMILKPQFSVFREKKEVKSVAGVIKYTLVIGFKDGRYRYEIKDVNLKAASYYPIERLFDPKEPNMEDNYNTLHEAHKYFTDLVEDLQAGMREPSAKDKQDDW